MNAFLKKLGSRKLWLALAGVASGIAIALGADANDIQTITGAVTALVSAATYIITEGKVDAASISNAVTATQSAVEVVASEGDEKK